MTQVMRRMQDMTDNDTNEWTMGKKRQVRQKRSLATRQTPKGRNGAERMDRAAVAEKSDTKKSQDPTPGSRNIKTLLLNLPKVNA